MYPHANYSSYGALRRDLGMRHSVTSGLNNDCLANSTYGGGGYFDPSVPDTAACKASDAARATIYKELMRRLNDRATTTPVIGTAVCRALRPKTSKR